jgi:hypothetical protein
LAHNPEVAGSNPAPATNITDRNRSRLRPALRCGKHRSHISNNL